MDEIFRDWLPVEDYAVANNLPGATMMITWTPVITRWEALVIFFLGARAGSLNIASIKVLHVQDGEAMLQVKQQSEKDTTDTELGRAIDRGLTQRIDVSGAQERVVFESDRIGM